MARIIPDRILEEIRSRTSIVDVISSRITLKRAGSVFKACCPFHREKTPSFTVNPARESFKCFGCGEGGDVFSFLMKHDGMTFSDAVRMLGDRCGVEVAFDDDGVITGVYIDASNETTDVGGQVGRPRFAQQFVGKTGLDGVDAVAGATISSTAAMDAVQKAVDAFSTVKGA